MKKTYISPEIVVARVQQECVIALSLVESEKANDNDALVKGNGDWNIWDSEEE